MVRRYTRINRHARNGKLHKPYNSFKSEDLESAKIEVNAKVLSIRKAAEKYNIPKSTLARHCKEDVKLQEKAGRPTIFTKEEEDTFVKFCLTLSEWGFPMDKLDLRVFAQKYLNKIGRTVYFLKDNMPGRDWVLNFLDRHKKQLSNRVAANISTDRAKITSEEIDAFFEHYEKTIEGVSPENIINYDETNLTDDPGAKKYIFKRGCKYPERLVNNSKTAVSLMFSGTASGEMLPIYVVYKSEHLWDQWLEGGPEKCRYNRSKSGWFDLTCFEDWFFTIIVPFAKTKDGRKVIIGDNLSSHFSETVLEACQKYDITFVCLPPKTTHLLQPLDVAFYAPLKHYWRIILTEWKSSGGRQHKTLLKSAFPQLLKKLDDLMLKKQVSSANIKSGFEKCGLWPINPARPKSRIPTRVTTEEINVAATEIVVDMLEKIRCPQEKSQTKRKRRCEVEPGKSITVEDITRAAPKIKQKKRQNKGSVNESKKKSEIQKQKSIQSNPAIDSSSAICQSGIIDIDVKRHGFLSDSEEEQKGENSDGSPTNRNVQLKRTKKSAIDTHKKKKKVNRRYNNKLKRNQSPISSNSDVEMSEHTDSDIVDVDSDATYCSNKEYQSDESAIRRRVNDIEMKIWEEIEEIDKKTEQETIDISNYKKKKVDKQEQDKEQIICKSKPLLDTFFESKETDASVLKENNNKLKEICGEEIKENQNNGLNSKTTEWKQKYSSSCMSEKENSEMQESKLKNETSIEREKEERERITRNKKEKIERECMDNDNSKKTSKKTDKDCILNETELMRKKKEKSEREYERECKNMQESELKNETGIEREKEERERITRNKKKKIERECKDNDNIKKTTEKTDKDFMLNETEFKKEDNNLERENMGVQVNKAQINDTVLVRYYSRRSWKYYIGVIQEIYEDEKRFKISYYKSVKQKGNLMFKKPKHEDIDVIPDTVIVKFVELLQISENPEEFILNNEEDSFYF